MKGNRKRLVVYVLMVCMVLFGITASAKPAEAAGGTGISGYLFGMDETDEPCIYSPAAAVISSGNEYYIMTSLDVYNYEAAVSFIYISAEGNGYNVEPYGMDETWKVMQWSVTSGTPDASFYELGVPYENEECNVYYMDTSGNEYTAAVTLTGVSNDGGIMRLTATGGPDVAYYPPALLVDGDGKLVGLALEGGIWGILASEDTFYGNSGNDNGGGNDSGSTGGSDNSGGNDNAGGSGGGNDNSGGGNDGDTEEKSGGIQKYWWLLLIGAGAIGGGIFLKKKQDKGNPQPDGVQDITFQNAAPYNSPMQPTPIQPAPTPIQPASIQPAPAPVSGGRVEEIGATTPYTPPATGAGASAKQQSSTVGKSCRVCAVGGYMDGRTYPMDAREITFGRDASVSIRYPSDTKGVSRIHCKLYWQGNTLMLVDLGSSYGTFVEGKGKLTPQTPVALKEGDKFCLGEKKNMFIIKKA